MNEKYCQSCAMPMGEEESLYGTNADGSVNEDYCKYCYSDGKFTKEETMEEMIDSCIPFMTKENDMTESQARALMMEVLPNLKRWKKAD